MLVATQNRAHRGEMLRVYIQPMQFAQAGQCAVGDFVHAMSQTNHSDRLFARYHPATVTDVIIPSVTNNLPAGETRRWWWFRVVDGEAAAIPVDDAPAWYADLAARPVGRWRIVDSKHGTEVNDLLALIGHRVGATQKQNGTWFLRGGVIRDVAATSMNDAFGRLP